MSIQKTDFGTLSSGENVDLYVLTNSNGLSAKITNYGGIIVELNVPDRDGKLADILLGKDSLDDYLAGHPYFACITGRVAGRIAGASFELEGATYPLLANNGPNNLHGGPEGFDTILWDASIVVVDGIEKLRLSTTDPDGNNGFPGTIECSVTYALLEDDSLEITYEATTTKTTPFNITNHAYFNLRGQGNGDVLDHQFQIFADTVASVDEDSTLIGRRDPVTAGFNDFRQPVRLGDQGELVIGNADIHFFVDGGRTEQPKPAATVYEPESGRVMEVLSTEPGVQFYAGLFLDEPGKGGVTYSKSTGFCLETQDYADSVHFPDMGGAILRPGDTFKSTTHFKFSTRAS